MGFEVAYHLAVVRAVTKTNQIAVRQYKINQQVVAEAS